MEPRSGAPANAEAPTLPTGATVALEAPSAKLGATNSPPENAGGGAETASVMADAGKSGGITGPLGSPDDALAPVGGPGGDADMMGDAEEDDDDAPQTARTKTIKTIKRTTTSRMRWTRMTKAPMAGI